MPRARLALLAATAVAGLLAGLVPAQATAATPPLVTDPTGDAIGLGPSWDIVSANLATTGVTKKVGRRSVYTPTALIASVTLAGPPSTQVGSAVNFHVDMSACGGGYIEWSYLPGSKAGKTNGFVSGCGAGGVAGSVTEYVGDGPVVKGNTISWKVRLKEMGKDLPLGTIFRNALVTTDIADPYFGLFGTQTAGALTSIDDARSTGSYELG